MKKKLFFGVLIVIHNTVYSSALQQPFDLLKNACNGVAASCSEFGWGKVAVVAGLGGAVGYYVCYRRCSTNSLVNRHAVEFKSICCNVVNLEKSVDALLEKASDPDIAEQLEDAVDGHYKLTRYKQDYLKKLRNVSRSVHDASEELFNISEFWKGQGVSQFAVHPKSKIADNQESRDKNTDY